jgi:hypothetical protein
MSKKSSKKKLTKKIPIYYNKRITQKKLRKNYIKYNINNCKIITKNPYKNKDNFIKLINLYKIDKLKTDFTIYPYCSEKINFSIYLDKENMFIIDKTLLKIIENKYKCEFKKDSNLIKEKKNHFVAQKNNPCKFIKYLLENLNNKNHFIITHSHFLKKLSNYIRINYCDVKKNSKNKEKDIYDNLDILQLVIDTSEPNNYKLKYGIIRRLDEKYKLYKKYEIGSDKTICNKNTRSVFLMRHCLACHNVSNIFLRQIKLGYGTYSSCIENTNTEIKSVSKELKKIIKDYGGIKTFNFGSSIIFRAILTILILYNSIKN